ncbi:MAG: hypothetical protein JO083_09855 [Candidatus Eremiobacteraeota bacterium]|nr:hypothetical protein [Candidatus Eremiobacteraeota bacterium]MBV8370809.1 hypothetical protein [Candidatus Eremiobacteraeota bacterium]
MIFKGSRYQNVGTYTATDASGATVTALRIRFIPPTPAGFFHAFVAGERLDVLAYNYYRDAQKSWLIADANAPVDPDDVLEIGRRIAIPPDRS